MALAALLAGGGPARAGGRRTAGAAAQIRADAADLAVTWGDAARAAAWAAARLAEAGLDPGADEAGEEGGVFHVHPDNVPVGRLMLAARTAWRWTLVAGAAGAARLLDGVDWPALRVLAQALDLAWDAGLVADVQVVEAAVMRRARAEQERTARRGRP